MSHKITLKEIVGDYAELFKGNDPDAVACVIACAMFRTERKYEKSNSPDHSQETGIILCLIGESGTGKTTLLRLLPAVYFQYLSNLTVKTFLSSYENGKHSILQKGKERVGIVFGDLANLVKKNKTEQEELMQQFRTIFDGEYIRTTGYSKEEWKGRFVALLAATPYLAALDEEHATSGRRMIYYDLTQSDDAYLYMHTFADRRYKDLQNKILQFFAENDNWTPPILNKQDRDFISTASMYYSLLRISFDNSVRHLNLTNTGVDTAQRIGRIFTKIVQILKMLDYDYKAIIKTITLTTAKRALILCFDFEKNETITRPLLSARIKQAGIEFNEAYIGRIINTLISRQVLIPVKTITSVDAYCINPKYKDISIKFNQYFE